MQKFTKFQTDPPLCPPVFLGLSLRFYNLTLAL